MFWNLNRNSPLSEMAVLTRDRKIDLIILAESRIRMADMLQVLATSTS